MKTIRKIKALRRELLRLRREGKTVGFVPTMGFLHEGHLTLVRRARKGNGAVVVSLFVNPRQFGPREDFSAYPRDLAGDSRLLRKEGVDVLFAPSAEEMYPPGFATRVSVGGLTAGLCGASRPGHFDGVATVVARLFGLVGPCRAYFGLKDFQQVQVVRRMAADLSLPVRVIGVPTVRERDGLALSSRNTYLSAKEREDAPVLSRALGEARAMVRDRGIRDGSLIIGEAKKTIESAPGTRIDYLDLVHPETLEPVREVGPEGALLAMAVFVGKTRLIDNALLRIPDSGFRKREKPGNRAFQKDSGEG